ncbi:MAG TPA: adenine phosphoribosyltransferase [Thermoanaerobaculia bacterium]|jgi:adenine phosphoribosyltransferase|nr:adenine phosphoribosyltransferase [Thermoanaerobaculia bacterium]
MTDFRAFVRDVPDFPSPGILFRDVTPLLASPDAFAAAAWAMAEPFRAARPDKVLGIEARGFLFGTALARELHVGIVPARKAGKLPRATESVSYGLEYGKDCLEIHADAFGPGERVLVVDDVLATGGTAKAAADLAEKLGAHVVGISVFIELGALGGRARLGSRPAHAVLML